MKIALVHMRQRGTGGTEKYLNHIARHCCARAHDVTLICRRYEFLAHPAMKVVALRDFAPTKGMRIQRFAQSVDKHVRASDYDVVFGLGKTWTHDVLRMGGGCHQTYMDIAHGHTSGMLERCLEQASGKHRIALAIEKRALAPGACRFVITNSDMVKEDVIRRYQVPRDKIRVIRNGVDVARYRPEFKATLGREFRRQYGLCPDHFVVLFLGTGYGRKGLKNVLQAMPVVMRMNVKVRLLVVGYDSSLSRYRHIAEALGIRDKVLFLGGRRDAHVCYAASDLYVLPTHYDPFANSTLEALSSGLPVVTSVWNGGCEILEEGVHGSILDARADAALLAESIIAWTDPERCAEARDKTRALALQYTEQDMADRTLAVLQEAVSCKKSDRAPTD